MKISIKASDGSSKKYRIDIYKANNPDYLMKREYKMFNSEEDAVEYGTSIANGNEVVVNQVKASTRSRRTPIRAGYYVDEIMWVLDGDDNTWKQWGSKPGRVDTMSKEDYLYRLNHPQFPNPEFNTPRNYVDFIITKNGENPDDYGYTENIKDPFVKASTSTRSSRSSIMAATDEYMLSEVIGEKDAIIDEWRNTYDGEPSTSWDEIFDSVVNDFELYCDDEASSYGEDRTLKEKFDAGVLSESDMLSEFYDFIRFIDLSDYDTDYDN